MAFTYKTLDQIAKARNDFSEAYEKDPYMGYEKVQDAIDAYKFSSQVEVMARLLNRENVFISGLAGSGKTTLIQRFVDLIDAEYYGAFEIAVTATTGIAASIMNGRTLHSWMGLTPDDTGEFDPKQIPHFTSKKSSYFKYTDTLIIDEVSMMPAWQFTKLNAMLKHFRENDEPFGGIQLVLIGDFLQLPPVANRDNSQLDNRFIIETDDWAEANIKCCFMDKVHRATDSKLKNVLAAIVSGKMNDKIKDSLMARHIDNVGELPDKATTTLFTVNRDVDRFNSDELAKNTNKPHFLVAEDYGQKKFIEQIYKESRIPRVLQLKVGATVMLTSNYKTLYGDFFANGSLGVVESITNAYVRVKFNNGKTLNVEKVGIRKTEKVVKNIPNSKPIVYEIVIAEVSQFPLKLGYAITTHKSQGQTFSGVVVDLSKCFTPGLGYVALSRVRSLEDLVILAINDKAFAIDPKSDAASRRTRREAKQNREDFIKDLDYYEFLVSSSLGRRLVWDDTLGGAVKILEAKQN